MEEINEVKVVRVDFKCPKCGIGYLRPTGTCLTTNPPQYPHNCNNHNCNYGKTFAGKTYPYIDYI
jgi:hypothetical protein